MRIKVVKDSGTSPTSISHLVGKTFEAHRFDSPFPPCKRVVIKATWPNGLPRDYIIFEGEYRRLHRKGD